MDCSPPGSSVHGIFQARILEWITISFSKGFSWTGIKPVSFALAGKFFFFAHSELLYGGFYSFFSIQVTLQTLLLRFEDCEVITQTNKNIWEADC